MSNGGSFKSTTNGIKMNGSQNKNKIVSLRNLSEHSAQVRSAVGVDDPLFQSFPSEVLFHDFEAFSSHEAIITLRNKDLVARRVQLEPPSSHFFTLSAVHHGHNASNKVAPGMEVKYTLTFKPESSADYNCDLICTTEREQFVIPVRARGARAKLDYPSRIDFPCAPVNFPSSHPFLLRNYGPRATSFSLKPPAGFTVSPSEGHIEVGESINVTLVFTPSNEGKFAGELWINLDDGVCMSALLYGTSKSVDVSLEMSQLECPSTYIQLTSMKTLRLFNRSEIPIEFNWRNNRTREEEDVRRKAQLRVLAIAEEQERANIESRMDVDESEDDGMSEPSDDEDKVNFRRMRAEQAVTRKYRKLRHDLEEQDLAFTHEDFAIEPLSGEIYPNGQMEITVTFTPKAVKFYSTSVYCDVTGSTHRLPLQLGGEGIGPKAVFGFETLDIGDVYVNAVHRYEVTLQNVGEIAAEYQLIQPKHPSRFSFSPDRGVLAVGEEEGEEVKINITFTSDTLGDFVEVLEWSLQGTSKPLLLTFKGNVIGPTFYFGEQKLDFGLTSYGFLNSLPLTLHNTSEIPMKYMLRIPEDGKFMDREFGITPNSGSVFPGEQTSIQVDFIPETVKIYEDYSLVIDIQGVGQALLKIPITAECQVSDVIVDTDTLNFGEVFLRHPVTKPIPMRNLSDLLHSKFEVQPQDEASKEVATIMPERPTAAIGPSSSYELNVTLTAHRLGVVNFPFFIKVPGRGGSPKIVTVKSTVVGPKVALERNIIDWGKVFVLRDTPIELKMTNESPIPAEFKAFLHKKGSCFSVDPPQGRMKPFESITMTVVANLNEILKMSDVMHILIHEGADLQVNLSARGVGTTISSSTAIEKIDHGDQFTSNSTTSTFRLENHGRRAQTLVWNFVPPAEENDPKAASKRRKNKKDEVELPSSVFTITPRKIVLEPFMAMEFTVQGMTTKPGKVDEQWICGALIGKDAKEYVDIYTCRVMANFIDPLVEFSRTEISFTEMNDPKNMVPASTESLSLKNVSSLPLVFWMQVPAPFTADRLDYELAPGESASTSLKFLPGVSADKQSTKIKSNLVLKYADHPQRDKLPLFGEISFPNLSFESTKIDFGCVLNETSKRLIKKITNNSSIEVVYEWVFYEDVLPGVPTINEVFDILPISGVLAPGASEDVEFVFYGNVDSKVSGLAVCEVVGGPEYEIALIGEASSVAYRLDQTELDFGPKDMGSVESREIMLFNTGRVAFEFTVDLKMISQPVVTVSPLTGKLNAGDKQKVTVTLEAKLPSKIKEQFQLAVAYFDPVPVFVSAIGVFPSFIATLPRAPTQDWQRLCMQAEEQLNAMKEPEERLVPIPPALKSSVPEVEMYLEADRICYLEHATQEIRDESRLGRTKSRTQAIPTKTPFIIAHYVCDFSNVILGQQKKTIFKLTNVSDKPLSFDINKRVLTGSIFTIEPMQVLRAPPGQTVEFSVQCVTNSRKHKPELVNIDVPVIVRGGPEVKLSMKANITLPGLEVSETKLDFGSVYVGQRKEIAVQLHNTKEVPCEWNIKSLIASSNGEDKDNFQCIPMSGTLAPDGRQNVVIAFQPLEKKKMTVKVPIKVAMNPKGQSIFCKGTGLEVGLAFEPGSVSLGPVLPYQLSQPMEVKVSNTCGKDIEVYSLDFDDRFSQEEDILRADETYNEDRVLFVPPRNPGEALPTFILKAHRMREKKRLKDAERKVEKEKEAAAKEAPPGTVKDAPGTAPGTAKEALGTAKSGSSTGKDAPTNPETEAKDESVGDLMTDAADEVDVADKVFNIVVTGGPFSGVTTVVNTLAKFAGIERNVVTSMDEVLQWALDVETQVEQFKKDEEEAKRIRESGSKKEKDMLAAKEAEGIKPPSFSEHDLALAKEVKQKLTDFRSKADDDPERSGSQKSKRPSKKPSPRKKGKGDEADDSGFSDCLGSDVFGEDLLTSVIKVFVLQPRFSTGIIFDNLDATFASVDLLARCLKNAFDQLGAVRENNLHMINLAVDRDEAVSRVDRLSKQCNDLMEDKEMTATLKKFKVLNDKEIAKLAGDKLAKYEETLLMFNKREEATKTVEKLGEAAEKINEFYGVTGPVEDSQKQDPLAEGGVQQTSLPPLQFHIVLQMFGMEYPQGTAKDADVVIKPTCNWAKSKQFAPCSLEDMQSKAKEYVQEVFYIAEDPSLTNPSWVPPPVLYQLIRYPEQRRQRPPSKNFFFVDRKEELPPPVPQVVEEVSDDKKKKSESRKGKKPGKEAAPEEEAPPAAAAGEQTQEPVKPIVSFERSKQTRWIIPAKGQATIYVQFVAETTGRFDHQLSFEIVGSQVQFDLGAKGTCAVPEIAQEPRSVFMRRTKSRKHGTLVHKQYVTSDKVFDFGPLLLGKDPTSRLLPPTEDDKKKMKGKSKKPMSAVRRINGEVFRITNTGLFDLQVDFAFRDGTTSVIAKPELVDEAPTGKKGAKAVKKKEPPPKKVAKGKGKKEDVKEEHTGPVTDPNQPIFIVEPPSLFIPQEEMREITVWSFPQEVSTFDDVLVCSIKDNPECVQFPVRCEGSKPAVELNVSQLVFERLLIGQSDSKDVEVKNVSSVPVAWSLTGLEALGQELTITPNTSGVIQPLDSTLFTVTFKAIEQNEYSHNLSLEIRDTEDILGLVDTKPIEIQAEAFKMDAAVELPEKGLDFEILRVNEAAQREFKIVNKGKYNIKFDFSTAPRSKALFDEILVIEPKSGDLAPAQEQMIVVTAKTSKEETVKCSDLKLHLIEGGTAEVVQNIPVPVALRSVFSQFRLLPVHGVNFGPLEVGVTKTKTMQICNDGEFEFLFRMFAAKDREKYPEPLSAEPEEDPKDKKGGKKKAPPKKEKKTARGKGKGDADGESAALGPFTVTPTEGSIPPGTTLDVTVTMEATQIESYLEVLEVDISQRELEHPGGHMADANRLTLDLTGESCSPGVDTTGYESIFEEQMTTSKIGGRVVDKNFFAIEEKTFVFAPVIANQKPESARCERFRISNPFKVPCNVQLRVFLQGAAEDKPASARSSKKPPKKATKKDETAEADGPCPFKVDPPALHIPNHEHRYVTVWFNPTALKAYTAVFEATVDKGTDPRTRQLTFELRGEGTLPHLSVSEPSIRTEDGIPLLAFDRVFCHPQLNRSLTKLIVLYNPGIVPATARFDMDPSDEFVFSGFGKMVVVDPGAEHRLDVTYHPKQPGLHEKEIKMSILQNPFELSTFKLTGQGYLEDVALEAGTEGASGEELNFGDVPLGSAVTRLITLVNYSSSPYRFSWQPFAASATTDAGKGKAPPKKKTKDEADATGGSSDFIFSPSVGHIQPNSSKTVTVTFQCSTTRLHEKVPVKCDVSKIRYLGLEERKALKSARAGGKGASAKKGAKPAKGATEEAPPADDLELDNYDLANMEWDDSMKVSKWVQEQVEEPSSGRESKNKKDNKKKDEKEPEKPKPVAVPKMVEVVEMVPEPDFEEVKAPAGKEDSSQVTKELTTQLSAVCDRAVYECKVKSVNFRPTMMFQTREFKFPIKNTSTINLNYKWHMKKLEHNSKLEGEVSNPFSITEVEGTIAPGQEEEFSIKFSPLDSLTYGIDLIADIDNLPEDCERPFIKLRGIGQRPKCHFELVNSDYLTGQRRQVGLPGPGGAGGPLDPAYRVIEFKSLGIKVRNTRRFYVMNPTNISYAFEWRCEDGPGSNPFRCNTTKGIVESGRKFEMIFEFTPEQDQSIVESFWRFEITDHDINLPVLLVGSVAEPEVKLDRSNIKFEALMLGRQHTEKVFLVNTEHIPFSFQIDKSSIQSGGIEVKPLSGVVGPEQRLPISVTFMPNREMEYNWNVLFNIRNKPGRVALNVKGEGYAVSSNVTLKEEKGGNIQRDLFREETNKVDFGAVHIYEKRVKTVIIANEGKFTFNYQWKLPQNRFVTIHPMSGTVRAGSKGEVDISYYTATEAAVDNLLAVCTIANSPANKYVLAISGRGKKPNLEFSFLQHDFGKCFVNDAPPVLGAKADAPLPTLKTLKIVNHEHDQNVAIDMVFEGTTALSIPPTASVLAPGEAVEAVFKFAPTENRKYKETVPFEINGLYKINVVVTGEGTPLKLDLKDPEMQAVNFGQVRVAGSASRNVTLVNSSKKTVTFSLSKPPRATAGPLDKYLTVYPAYGQEVSLRPRDAMRIELVFEPEQRMPVFNSEILITAHGVTRRLLELAGACHGVGMRLESDKVPFGNVIQHSSLTRKVKLSNTGDVGSNYKWQEHLYKPHFTINPKDGFLPAGGNVTMEVTFHPKNLSPDIRIDKVPCLVDGQEMPDMYLTLSGGCVEQPKENVEERKFNTKVRQATSQTVTIANPTEKRWTIRPSIQNGFWSGESTVEVPANGQATYTINFTPLSMTKESAEGEGDPKSGKKGAKDAKGSARPTSKSSAKRPTSTKRGGSESGSVTVRDLGNNANRPEFHEGLLFFPLPNGKALNYRLVGYATLADPEGTIEVSIPAKSTAIESLVVKNWLNEYQRFKVMIEMETKDESVTITGADTVDVPGLTERNYKLSLHAFKEGTTQGSVTFLNESTGESLSYTLLFTATSPKTFDSIPKFVTAIMQKLVHNLVVNNPLETEAVINNFTCDEPTVFVPTPITIPPKSSGTVPVHFRPLVAFESKKANLVLPTSTLGEFKYQLDLTCIAHVAEKSLHFNTNLGNEVKQTYRFVSYATAATEYDCKVTGSQFMLDAPKVSAPAAAPGSDGVEVAVEIRYEPSACGAERAVFTASSTIGGSYNCILFGTCEQPKPQGPIALGAGQTAQVRFKNVLDSAENFNFSVDTPSFILAKKTEKLAAKGVVSLAVQYKPDDYAGGGKAKKDDKKAPEENKLQTVAPVTMGKLLVSCPSKPGLTWVYYLRGTRE